MGTGPGPTPPPARGLRYLQYRTGGRAGTEHRRPAPGQDGSRAILELIILQNTGLRGARGAGFGAPLVDTWGFPPLTGAMEVGESDFSPDAVIPRGRLGQARRTAHAGAEAAHASSIRSCPRTVSLGSPIGPAAVAVNLLVEERDAQVTGRDPHAGGQPGRSRGGASGAGPARSRPGAAWSCEYPKRIGSPPAQIVAALVAAVALVLGLASWRLLRPQPRGTTPESPDRLLDVIAALDARYLGREAETPPEQWQAYEAERARLKAALEATLAEASPTR